jgi:hypothetical protein
MNRPVSVAEILDLQRDVRFALYPAPGFRVYTEWEDSKGDALTKLRTRLALFRRQTAALGVLEFATRGWSSLPWQSARPKSPSPVR